MVENNMIPFKDCIYSRRWFVSGEYCSKQANIQKEREELHNTGEINAFIDEISPCAHVKNDTVFSLFAYGPKDKIVPPKLKNYLFEAFVKEKANYEYIEFSNSNHMMYSDLDKTKEYIDKSLFYLDKYIG